MALPVAAVPTADDRAVTVDGAAVAVISAGICLASDALIFMTVLVPSAIGLRFLAWRRLPTGTRSHGLGAELALFAGCMALGAFNDWNSVVRHRIYDYTVPHFLPNLSSIPCWMLLYWGLIVRFLITVCRWRRLEPPAAACDRVRGMSAPAPWLKLALQLALIVGTRQAIYRLHDDPLWSWAPFALALATWLALFGPSRHDLKLLAIVALVGPGIEILYIQVGHLHHYQLGWLAGVPIWIALWWLLAVLIVSDVSARVLRWLVRPAPS